MRLHIPEIYPAQVTSERLQKSMLGAGLIACAGYMMQQRKQIRDLQARDQENSNQIEELSKLAYTNEVTGLPSRRPFNDHFTVMQKMQNRGDIDNIGIVELDATGLKVVNDRISPVTGDKYLQTIGTVLREHLRPGDMLAHMSGDEFGILANLSVDQDEQNLTATDQIELIQDRLLHAVANDPFVSELTQEYGHLLPEGVGFGLKADYTISLPNEPLETARKRIDVKGIR